MSAGNRSLLGVLLLAVALAGGCSKQQPASDPTAGTNAATAGPATAAPAARGPGPMAPPSQAAVITESGNVDATLAQLSLELRKFVIRTRSVPKDFEDFIAKSHVQAPAAPAGKKYAIQNQAVVLVKR